ncbi:hypothetical protein TNCV_3677141 [Trichonephila clavipes]|nr:hypothetical protein TNCV_3677141 [Trichonephila clavipes]
MNSPVQLAEKLEEFEDFKRTLKQKSSSPFVKKQEFKSTEKNRRYEAKGKLEYNRKDRKFPASTNYNKHYECPCYQVRICSKISRQRAERVLQQKLRETLKSQCFQACSNDPFKITEIQREPPKETCTLIVKEGLSTKEIFFGKLKITARIDSGSTISLL